MKKTTKKALSLEHIRRVLADPDDGALPAQRLLCLAGVSPVEEQVVVGVPDVFGRRDFLKVLRYA